MILNRMLGVPSVGTGRQRWIDNHGELNANNCRFGGENGGMTVAVHYASFVCYPCGNVGCEPCVATPRKSSPSRCVLFRRSSKRAAVCCTAHDVAPYNTTPSGLGPSFQGGGMRFHQCDMFSKCAGRHARLLFSLI